MLGDIISSAVSAFGAFKGAERQNEMAMQAAQRQMDFQERMSNTAYQRAMADMKEAGLNPMLVAHLGGASSPVGAMPNIVDELSGISPAATSAAGAMAGYRQTRQATRQSKAQVGLINSQKLVQNATAKQVNANTALLNQKARLTKAQTTKTHHDARVSAGTATRMVQGGDSVLGRGYYSLKQVLRDIEAATRGRKMQGPGSGALEQIEKTIKLKGNR